MALFPGLPRWAGTRKVKTTRILLKQETVSGSGISWAVCKSAPRSRQITTPAPHHSVFYRPDALRAAQPTASMHWNFIEPIIIAIFELRWCSYSVIKSHWLWCYVGCCAVDVTCSPPSFDVSATLNPTYARWLLTTAAAICCCWANYLRPSPPIDSIWAVVVVWR